MTKNTPKMVPVRELHAGQWVMFPEIKGSPVQGLYRIIAAGEIFMKTDSIGTYPMRTLTLRKVNEIDAKKDITHDVLAGAATRLEVM